jgi:hypothetical protein
MLDVSDTGARLARLLWETMQVVPIRRQRLQAGLAASILLGPAVGVLTHRPYNIVKTTMREFSTT